MGDNELDAPDVSSDPHPWHTFDVEEDLEVRQASGAGEPNRWEVRRATPPPEGVEWFITVLDDAEFQQLCAPGPNPKGL